MYNTIHSPLWRLTEKMWIQTQFYGNLYIVETIQTHLQMQCFPVVFSRWSKSG